VRCRWRKEGGREVGVALGGIKGAKCGWGLEWEGEEEVCKSCGW